MKAQMLLRPMKKGMMVMVEICSQKKLPKDGPIGLFLGIFV